MYVFHKEWRRPLALVNVVSAAWQAILAYFTIWEHITIAGNIILVPVIPGNSLQFRHENQIAHIQVQLSVWFWCSGTGKRILTHKGTDKLTYRGPGGDRTPDRGK